MSSFYLTSPIYYASGEPHLGHAYTTILADVLARYRRRAGEDVLFLTGTDEHGQKIQEAAAQQGIPPRALCDLMAGRFRAAWEDLNISHDRFIRTTEPGHAAVVSAILERLRDNGLIYEGEYAGWYSVGQERYFTEKEVGPDRKDPVAGGPVEHIREKNYFFRMSRFQERLRKHVEDNPEWIVPAGRRNEILGFLARPLGDLSISRPRSRIHWGIPLPWDPDQTTYVWVDALINYVTASGAVDAGAPRGRQGFGDAPLPSRWPADVHLMGKDILTTHAVYWPALLMGADLPLPRKILAHGWWVVGATKMSKSLGNVVDPLGLRDRFGTDAVRWYLMREMPTGQDASYTPERFMIRYEELSNVLGNLVHRVVSMVKRYCGGTVPSAPGHGLRREIGQAVDKYRDGMEGTGSTTASRLRWSLRGRPTASWRTGSRGRWLATRSAKGSWRRPSPRWCASLRFWPCLFEPVAPQKSQELARRIGLPRVPRLTELEEIAPGGQVVSSGPPLFPRVEEPRPSRAGG